jgi:hypothetical protein
MPKANYSPVMTSIHSIRRNALRSLVPTPRLQLSEWIEADFR